MLKKYTQKKQIKKTKLSLQLFFMANFDLVNGPIDMSLERTPIWEYPKIGPWFEIMTSVNADLRSGRRLETGHRSESIIYILFILFIWWWQIAVLGACKCRVTSPEPCGCAHAAAHLRQEMSRLKSQVFRMISSVQQTVINKYFRKHIL